MGALILPLEEISSSEWSEWGKIKETKKKIQISSAEPTAVDGGAIDERTCWPALRESNCYHEIRMAEGK